MHIPSTFKMHRLVFKSASIDIEFPTFQDISVGIYGRFFLYFFKNYVGTQSFVCIEGLQN